MTPNQDRNRFQELLEQELNKKTNYNKDLIEERNRLTQDQLGLGQKLRSEWANQNLDPLMRENLLSQRRSQLGGRVGTVTDLLGARGQYFGDILSKSLAGYDAEVADRIRQEEEARRRSAAAQQASAQQAYMDLLREQMGGQGDQAAPARNTGKVIDPNEERYNTYKNLGYSDEEAFNYVTQGIPQDTKRMSERGGFQGWLGKTVDPGLNWLQKVIYGKNDGRFEGGGKSSGSTRKF